MPLDDDDRAELEEMIAEAVKKGQPPAPPTSRRGEQSEPRGEWDRMSGRDQTSYIRQVVEDRLAELDAEAERQDLRRQNEELRKKVAEWEKAGRPGKRPTRGSKQDDQSERTPTVVSKAYKWLFGDQTATPGS